MTKDGPERERKMSVEMKIDVRSERACGENVMSTSEGDDEWGIR